jgi:quinoprotein relay system zinc metallohydrolase 2
VWDTEKATVKRFICISTLLVKLLLTSAMAQNSAPTMVTQVASGVFVAEGRVELANGTNLGAIANRTFIVGDEGVAVIDTGGSFVNGVSFKAAIRAVTQLPIRYVINTHMHPDHVLGNAAFRDEGTVFVGHAKLPRALASRAQQYLQSNRALIGEAGFAGTEIVPPTLLVDSEMSLDLGHRILRLTAYPTAHTDNDLTVFDESTKTLLLGDLLFADHLPALDGSLNGWIGLLDRLVTVPAARAVPGHGPVSVPWPQGAAAERAYLTALRGNLRAAVKAGWPLARALDAIPADKPEQWRLIEEFHKRNISAAYGEMEWE